ncbi:RHS repeat-associated core domain-containing protein [Bordetella bronchialis]|uniref:RHS repeat-associated core domain-containing protein n=1 Tax=Bordetella bronchialis TaxID=463025 RepID=A0ABM6CTS0_9BORD|nr:RHS repeat-associated core domain-containing protein [Bordetella bronchialis]ANN67454.1 hypothetical protein BAU06_15120 [Bordetella bronchialis]
MFPMSARGFAGSRQDNATSGYPLGNGYRWFLPVLMRFNAPDDFSPFGSGGINVYAYCAGDPVNHSDPDGHMMSAVELFQRGLEDAAEAARRAGDTISNPTDYLAAQAVHDRAVHAYLADPDAPPPGSVRPYNAGYEAAVDRKRQEGSLAASRASKTASTASANKDAAETSPQIPTPLDIPLRADGPGTSTGPLDSASTPAPSPAPARAVPPVDPQGMPASSRSAMTSDAAIQLGGVGDITTNAYTPRRRLVRLVRGLHAAGNLRARQLADYVSAEAMLSQLGFSDPAKTIAEARRQAAGKGPYSGTARLFLDRFELGGQD